MNLADIGTATRPALTGEGAVLFCFTGDCRDGLVDIYGASRCAVNMDWADRETRRACSQLAGWAGRATRKAGSRLVC